MLLVMPYNRERALEYARRWALDRNPLFIDFTGIGGDCTNFVSQCIYAGCCTMNYDPDFGWYFISSTNRSPSWTGVEFFYDFMVNNDEVGPFARQVRRREIEVGDVIQLADDSGDFYHTLFVSRIEGAIIYVAAHSNDALDRRLSSYDYAYARYLHIEGIRVEYDERQCFDNLINGISL